jgi:hypothetical protein
MVTNRGELGGDVEDRLCEEEDEEDEDTSRIGRA